MILEIFFGLSAAALSSPAHTDAANEDDPAARETGLYQLRFQAVRTCEPPARADSGSTTWVGFDVRAVAKVNELFVTARDFSLEKGGIILQPRHVNTPLLGRCLPLLPRAQLRARQSSRGFVLFEVPARFRSGDGSLVLAYRPTRWGGAPRVEFRLPPCLDSCAGGKPIPPPQKR